MRVFARSARAAVSLLITVVALLFAGAAGAASRHQRRGRIRLRAHSREKRSPHRRLPAHLQGHGQRHRPGRDRAWTTAPPAIQPPRSAPGQLIAGSVSSGGSSRTRASAATAGSSNATERGPAGRSASSNDGRPTRGTPGGRSSTSPAGRPAPGLRSVRSASPASPRPAPISGPADNSTGSDGSQSPSLTTSSTPTTSTTGAAFVQSQPEPQTSHGRARGESSAGLRPKTTSRSPDASASGSTASPWASRESGYVECSAGSPGARSLPSGSGPTIRKARPCACRDLTLPRTATQGACEDALSLKRVTNPPRGWRRPVSASSNRLPLLNAEREGPSAIDGSRSGGVGTRGPGVAWFGLLSLTAVPCLLLRFRSTCGWTIPLASSRCSITRPDPGSAFRVHRAAVPVPA